ncbi:MAG: hypothetical protein RR988_04915, partial [Clostridia bacterium]
MEKKIGSEKVKKEITPEDVKKRLAQLEQAKESKQRIEGFVKKVDSDFALSVSLGAGVIAYVPRSEVSSIVEEDGLPSEMASTSKLNKLIQFKVKDIFYNEDPLKPKIILSSKEVEMDVRKWMYMHLKP